MVSTELQMAETVRRLRRDRRKAIAYATLMEELAINRSIEAACWSVWQKLEEEATVHDDEPRLRIAIRCLFELFDLNPASLKDLCDLGLVRETSDKIMACIMKGLGAHPLASTDYRYSVEFVTTSADAFTEPHVKIDIWNYPNPYLARP